MYVRYTTSLLIRRRNLWIVSICVVVAGDLEVLDINRLAYRPLRGNSYVRLTQVLADKKAIINPNNEDDQCFKWAVHKSLKCCS